MKKSVFKNKTFFYLLIGCIPALLLWNLYALIITGNTYALIPAFSQIILLVLILTRDKYARIAIIIWAIILIIGPSLGLLADVLDIGNNLWDNDFKGIDVYNVVNVLVQLAGGILVLDFTRRTVRVEYPVIKELESIQP
jgi:hypothetical protein